MAEIDENGNPIPDRSTAPPQGAPGFADGGGTGTGTGYVDPGDPGDPGGGAGAGAAGATASQPSQSTYDPSSQNRADRNPDGLGDTPSNPAQDVFDDFSASIGVSTDKKRSAVDDILAGSGWLVDQAEGKDTTNKAAGKNVGDLDKATVDAQGQVQAVEDRVGAMDLPGKRQELASLEGEWADLNARIDQYNNGQVYDPTLEGSLNGEAADLRARSDAYEQAARERDVALEAAQAEYNEKALAAKRAEGVERNALTIQGDDASNINQAIGTYNQGILGPDDQGNLQQARQQYIADAPAPMTQGEIRSMVSPSVNNDGPPMQGPVDESVTGPALPGDDHSIRYAAADPTTRGFYKSATDDSDSWHPFTSEQASDIQHQANTSEIKVLGNSPSNVEAILADTVRPGGLDAVSPQRVVSVAGLVVGAGALALAIPEVAALPQAAGLVGRAIQVKGVVQGVQDARSMYVDVKNKDWSGLGKDTAIGVFDALSVGFTKSLAESGVRIIAGALPEDVIKIAGKSLLGAAILNGVPAFIPGPDALRVPGGLVMGALNYIIAGAANGSLGRNIANNVLNTGNPISVDGLRGLIHAVFEMSPEDYFRYQGLQNLLHIDPLPGAPGVSGTRIASWQVQLAAAVLGVVASDYQARSLNKGYSVIEHLDPFLGFDRGYAASVAAGMDPAAAARAQIDGRVSGLAEFAWAFDPFSPTNTWLGFPGLGRIADEALSRSSKKSVPTADLLYDKNAGSLYTGKLNGYTIDQLFNGLTKEGAARKVGGETVQLLQSKFSEGPDGITDINRFLDGARNIAKAQWLEEQSAEETRLGNRAAAKAFSDQADLATLEVQRRAQGLGTDNLGNPLPGVVADLPTAWAAVMGKDAFGALARIAEGAHAQSVDAQAPMSAEAIDRYYLERMTRVEKSRGVEEAMAAKAEQIPGLRNDRAALARLVAIDEIGAHVTDNVRNQLQLRTSAWVNENPVKVVELGMAGLGALRTMMLLAAAPGIAVKRITSEFQNASATAGALVVPQVKDLTTYQRRDKLSVKAADVFDPTSAQGKQVAGTGILSGRINSPVREREMRRVRDDLVATGQREAPPPVSRPERAARVVKGAADSILQHAISDPQRHQIAALVGHGLDGLEQKRYEHLQGVHADLVAAGVHPQVAGQALGGLEQMRPNRMGDYNRVQRQIEQQTVGMVGGVATPAQSAMFGRSRDVLQEAGESWEAQVAGIHAGAERLVQQAIGNYGDVAPIASVAHLLLPFAEFHFNATRVGIRQMVANPIYAYSMISYLQQHEDEFNRVPIIGDYVANLVNLSTTAHTADFFRKFAEYAQQAVADGGNTPAQKVERIAAHGLVGNDALVQAFPWASKPAEAALDRTSNPVHDARGKVAFGDDRKPASLDNGPTGAIRYGADKLAPENWREPIRNIAPYIGNPAGKILRGVGDAIDKGLGRPEPAPARPLTDRLPYEAMGLARNLGWDRARVQAAMNDQGGADYHTLVLAQEEAYDKDTMAKNSPIQVSQLAAADDPATQKRFAHQAIVQEINTLEKAKGAPTLAGYGATKDLPQAFKDLALQEQDPNGPVFPSKDKAPRNIADLPYYVDDRLRAADAANDIMADPLSPDSLAYQREQQARKEKGWQPAISYSNEHVMEGVADSFIAEKQTHANDLAVAESGLLLARREYQIAVEGGVPTEIDAAADKVHLAEAKALGLGGSKAPTAGMQGLDRPVLDNEAGIQKATGGDGKPTAFPVSENGNPYLGAEDAAYIRSQGATPEQRAPYAPESVLESDTKREAFKNNLPVEGLTPFEKPTATEHQMTADAALGRANAVRDDLRMGRELTPDLRGKYLDYQNVKQAEEGKPITGEHGEQTTPKDFLAASGYAQLGQELARAIADKDEGKAAAIEGRRRQIEQLPGMAEYFSAIQAAALKDEKSKIDLRRDDALLNPDTQAALDPLNRPGAQYRNAKGEIVAPGIFSATAPGGAPTYAQAPAARDQGSYTVRKDREYIDVFTDQQRASYDAYEALVKGEVGQKYDALVSHFQGDLGGYGTPAGKAWFLEHQVEYNAAKSAYIDALARIKKETGEDPVATVNLLRDATGGADIKQPAAAGGTGTGHGKGWIDYPAGSHGKGWVDWGDHPPWLDNPDYVGKDGLTSAQRLEAARAKGLAQYDSRTQWQKDILSSLGTPTGRTGLADPIDHVSDFNKHTPATDFMRAYAGLMPWEKADLKEKLGGLPPKGSADQVYIDALAAINATQGAKNRLDHGQLGPGAKLPGGKYGDFAALGDPISVDPLTGLPTGWTGILPRGLPFDPYHFQFTADGHQVAKGGGHGGGGHIGPAFKAGHKFRAPKATTKKKTSTKITAGTRTLKGAGSIVTK